jgi:hypothetical protein
MFLETGDSMRRRIPFPPAAAVSALLAALALGSCTYLPQSVALAGGVTATETGRAILLTPTAGTTRVAGLVFYPGALVDPHAYLPWLSDLAATGMAVVVAKMPGNMAVLEIDAGLAVRSLVPQVSTWVVAGHSLGGAMAAWSVANHPDAWKGLVLLAAYPADSESLASWSGPVLSLSASDDGLATPQKVDATKGLLPSTAFTVTSTGAYTAPGSGGWVVYHQVTGGNHAGFGSYGPQDGDGTATISQAAQHAEIVAFINEFFAQNGW